MDGDKDLHGTATIPLGKLDSATVDQMLSILATHFETMAFVGMTRAQNPGEPDEITSRLKGSGPYVFGLVEYLIERMKWEAIVGFGQSVAAKPVQSSPG